MYVMKAYIKDNFGILFVYGLTFFSMSVIQYLYGLTLEPVVYSFEVAGFLLFVLLGVRFYFYDRRYRAVQVLQRECGLYPEEFPKTNNAMEKNYQELLKQLMKLAVSKIQEQQHLHNEQMEYYTLWVHQIKTPISAIRLLIQEQMDPQGLLKQEVFKIEQYVEMVLQYLRIQNLSSDLVLEPCLLDEVIKHSIKKYSTLFIYKKIKVTLDTSPCTIVSDQKWCIFLVEQILSNALKYTKEGEIKITIKELPPKEVQLLITDTGIGIRPEDLQRIFERGYTGYNGRMDKKASGVGLYMVKKVTDTLGHKITITSEVNKGTTVGIRFLAG